MTTVARNSDGTVQFTLIIPQKTVIEQFDKTLDKAVETTEIKGFRKGKAPRNRVESHLGRQKLFTLTLQRILPEEYAKKAKELKLKPISNPKIEPKKIEEGADWELFITVVEKPKIELGDYKKIALGAKQAGKIWVPGQEGPGDKSGEKKPGDPEASVEKQLAKTLDALLKNIKFELSNVLLEEELNRLLSQLVQKLERLGLSLDQYLASINKTSDQLRDQYKSQAERNLKLELILNEIAEDLKITVEEAEIDKLINSVGDEKTKNGLNTPVERANIKASLRKRKALDKLMKL